MDLLSAFGLALVTALLVPLLRLTGARSRGHSEPLSEGGKPKFETTMNELRDLREALRPTEEKRP
jgi:hypothetical protein